MDKKNNQNHLKTAFTKALNSFISITPMLLGVLLLLGLFQNYITTDMLKTFFGFNTLSDLGVGTLFGSISSGNPITSYIISEELLNSGVSLYATSAFILSWVTLGFVHLPAEASVFGLKFTILKNTLTLLSTIAVAYFSVLTIGLF